MKKIKKPRLFFNKNKLFLSLATCGIVMSSASAYSQDDSFALEEVVVTAQFIEQNMQDIPIAVTALSGDLLDLRGQDNTTMIGSQAPSVQLQPGPAAQGNSLIAFIRGIGQQDNSPALEPGVGIYVDDVYFSNIQGSALDLLDIDRVEILRGPQGTLAGKNSIGGAIKIYSKRPDEERDGFIEASVGSFDARKIRGGSNFTLVEDELFLRLSGRYSERDGFVDNYDFGCLYPGSGLPTDRASGDCKVGELGGMESLGGRAALRWVPSDNLEINFGIDYIDDSSDAAGNFLVDAAPTLAPIVVGPPLAPGAPPQVGWPWFAPQPAPAGTIVPSAINPCVFITINNGNNCSDLQLALGGPAITDGYTTFSTFTNSGTGFEVKPQNTLESQNINLNVDWALNENMQLQSITALRTYEVAYANDDDGTPLSLSTQFNAQEHTALSQELRLNGTLGDSISYTVGAFYQDTETELEGNIDLTSSGVWFLLDDLVETTSYAVFSNVLWSINEQFELAAGLRYSDDEKTFGFARLNQDGTSPVACELVPNPEGGLEINPVSSPNCLVGGINDRPDQVFEDDRIDYRLALSYFPTEDVTLYSSIATGYKAGGANARPFFAEQLVPHDSEELISYELGAKFQLLDDTLRVNTAIFTNEYDDVIATLFECTGITGAPFGSPCFLPANIGKAEVSGFEFEFDWYLTRSLYLDGSYSYVDFNYTEASASISTSTQQAYTPEQTWSLGAQYDFEFDYGTISPRVDVVYQDELFTQPENGPNSFIDDYTLVNASVRWISNDKEWMVALEGRNITDEYYLSNTTDQIPSGYAVGNPALPRTWTASLRYNF